MKALFRILMVIFAALMPFVSSAQGGHRNTLLTRPIPRINPEEFLNINFEWNMPGKIQVLLNQGINSLNENSIQQAILNFNEAIESDPVLWPAWYYRGICYKILNRLQDAEYNLSAAARLKSFSEVHVELGIVAIMTNQRAKAIAEFKKATEIKSVQVEGYYYLGLISVLERNFTKARNYFQKSIDNNPKFVPAYLATALLLFDSKTDLDQPVKPDRDPVIWINKGIAADSTYRDSWLWRGVIYANRKQYSKALPDLNRTIAMKPNDAYSIIMRAEIFVALENYNSAFADLRKAFSIYEVNENQYANELNPLNKKVELQSAVRYMVQTGYGMDEKAFLLLKKSFAFLVSGKNDLALESAVEAEHIQATPTVYFVKGLIQEQLKLPEAANQSFLQALAIDNDIFEAHKRVAVYLTSQKDWKGAYLEVGEMIRIQPESNYSYSLRARIKFNQHDYFGTIIDVTRYLKNDSVNVEALELRGLARKEVGDMKGCLDDLVIVARYRPDVLLIRGIAENYVIISDTVRAVKYYRIFSKMTGNTFASHYEAAVIYINLKQWEDAGYEIGELKKYLQSVSATNKSTFSAVVCLEGMVAFNTGTPETAIEQFDKALKLNSRNSEARYRRGKALIKAGQAKKAIAEFNRLRKDHYLDSELCYQRLVASGR